MRTGWHIIVVHQSVLSSKILCSVMIVQELSLRMIHAPQSDSVSYRSEFLSRRNMHILECLTFLCRLRFL